MFLCAPHDLMRRAIGLAMRGRGDVEPNPMVGCIIMKDGRVIGEGYHQHFGGPHAERVALAACQESVAGATAFVTLEPCCHANKKTPPCVPALIEAKLRRVIIGCADPNPAVAGQGIGQLRQGGIDVEVGLLEAECRQLNAPFFAQVRHHRPYITLKWAQSADGKVAGPAGQRRQISSSESMRLVHQLRGRCDAILVGIDTVLKDDPLLTAREVRSSRPLLRVVLDSHLRIPVDSQLVNTAKTSPVLVLCSQAAFAQYQELVAALTARGVEIVPLSSDASGRLQLGEVVGHLATRPITHLLVEPGPTLAGAFLREGVWDRLWVFHAPGSIDDPTAPAGPVVSLPFTACAEIGGDHLVEYLNPDSAVFFAQVPSADFPHTEA
jgi:diaminohydroxyphosphoribosylaminopyrimidine deaminase/5-amino-6-(5-phosphoribosylamino)uracil reductase